MQTIGEKLEEARKRKGISIREAAETTKIRGDYLQKFEANSFGLDLPSLYIRGFVRAYARYLDLDAERFVAEYDSTLAAEGRSRRPSQDILDGPNRIADPEQGAVGVVLASGFDGAGVSIVERVIDPVLTIEQHVDPAVTVQRFETIKEADGRLGRHADA